MAEEHPPSPEREDEKLAVVGKIDDVSFVKQIRKDTEEFVQLIAKYTH